MIREFVFKDINQANNLLKILNFKLEKKSFNNDFLKIIVFQSTKDNTITGILVYQDLIDIITIDYIVVAKEFRKKGIATKLLKYMEEKHPDINNITLEVRQSNAAAINFYEKNGFHKVAKRKHYYNDEDAILMLKELR